MNKKPDIPYHPAYGYATEEQIEKLKSLGHGPDYGLHCVSKRGTLRYWHTDGRHAEGI